MVIDFEVVWALVLLLSLMIRFADFIGTTLKNVLV